MTSDYEEYRRQAMLCQENAQQATTPQLKADWLKLASDWLELIPPDERRGHDTFNSIMQAKGTGQKDSASSH